MVRMVEAGKRDMRGDDGERTEEGVKLSWARAVKRKL